MTRFTYQQATHHDIYKRHNGPYTCLVLEKYGHAGTKNRLTRAFPTGSSVHKYASELIAEDENVIAISVWSEADKYFVTTYQREEEQETE